MIASFGRRTRRRRVFVWVRVIDTEMFWEVYCGGYRFTANARNKDSERIRATLAQWEKEVRLKREKEGGGDLFNAEH